MRLDHSFLFSKVARRIFWLFVLCALIPIAILSVVSMSNVGAHLTEQAHLLLRQTSREEAMNIIAHLTFLQADMRLIGSAVSSESHLEHDLPSVQLPPKLGDRFKGLEILSSQGSRQVVYGTITIPAEFSEKERKFLGSGGTLVSVRECGSVSPCVSISQNLSRSSSHPRTLVAEVENRYLWDEASSPTDIDLCILDGSGRSLFCPDATSNFPAKVGTAFSGHIDWKEGDREYLSEYWTVPLKSMFFASNWTVIASETRSAMLAPLHHFERNFLLTVLLAFWMVLLLSLIQIRRNMVPLSRLQEGTRRLTSGDLAARVVIPGADEFADLASSFNSMASRIEQQVHSLKTASEIDRAILSSWDIEQIVHTLVTQLHTLFCDVLVSISLLDANINLHARTYVSVTGADEEQQVQEIEVPAVEAAALSRDNEIARFDLDTDYPKYLEPLFRRGMRCFLVAPIFLDSKLSAVLSLGRGAHSIWSEEDVQRAAQLAGRVAVAISNARLLAELKQLHLGTLTALARAIDAKSHWTLGHSERVTNWALKIAHSMGLPEHELDILRRGGLLHDIGKIGTPVGILEKPGKLTYEETQQMREHVKIGARILEPIAGFAECLPIVLQHHEWVNGSGYPEGLVGEQISLNARIFAVADCYDALVSERPYRPGMSPERAVEIICEGAGKQFDVEVVKVFLNLLDQEIGEEATVDVSLTN